MRFAWQGFSLDHPVDWAPVKLSGTYGEGYVQISGTGDATLQLRWLKSSTVSAEQVVQAYLDRLSRDAQKAHHAFERNVQEAVHGVGYTYRSQLSGRGCLVKGLENCNGRVFFLELAAPGNIPRRAVFEDALSSLRCPSEDLTDWDLLGLNVRLPSTLKLEQRELKAGKTALQFSGPRCLIRCERWGFAEQILAKHDLTDWAKAVSGLTSAEVVSSSEEQVEIARRGAIRPPATLLARVQPDRNQITLIRSESRSQAMRPQWNWFD